MFNSIALHLSQVDCAGVSVCMYSDLRVASRGSERVRPRPAHGIKVPRY